MTLLLPLGLLGLLGIAALVVIYIIKPNYQTQHISSSYVWKLSLKYRKRRIPTSRLRNILIFLCQIFILLLMAAILSMPMLVKRNQADSKDVILILDSSASMYAGNGDTRFNRAVDSAMDLADETMAEGGYVSVILADDEPRFLARRDSAAMRTELFDSLQELVDDPYACSYGSADIDGALALSEEVLAENSTASIYIYTDTEYDYIPDGITVVPIRAADEWNAAILDAHAELEDGYYRLEVEIACYGRDRAIDLNVEVNGANAFDASDEGINKQFTFPAVQCSGNSTVTVIFSAPQEDLDAENVYFFDLSNDDRFYSYHSIHLSIEEDDCFRVDNTFDIYGGQKETLKVQYASSDPNIFLSGALLTMANAYSEHWDVRITDVKEGTDPALSGFDFYIFEHKMPAALPTDGFILLLDPDTAPVGAGFTVREDLDMQGESVSLSGIDTHPLMRDVLADRLTVSRYTFVTLEEPFDVIMTCDGAPVFFAAKEESRQLAVMAFSGHYSNLFLMPEFVLLLMNMFDVYFPATVQGNAFEVGESIVLSGRGSSLTFSGAGVEETFTEFPAEISMSLPGTYTVEQTTYFEKETQDINIFVRIPRIESNTQNVESTLEAPVRDLEGIVTYQDLLIYLAAALVLLLFTEWWLQAKENK